MSVLVSRLDKLSVFQAKRAELDHKLKMLNVENEAHEHEFQEWMKSEFKFGDGPIHLAAILKCALETSVEPSRIIKP